MVNNRVKENVLVPVRVTLRINEDGIGISQSKIVTVFIPFPGSDMAL
jgi:hypothetical protein